MDMRIQLYSLIKIMDSFRKWWQEMIFKNFHDKICRDKWPSYSLGYFRLYNRFLHTIYKFIIFVKKSNWNKLSF